MSAGEIIRRAVPLKSICTDLDTQIRGETDRALANHYLRAMKSGEIFPPLAVADLGGALVLFDGFHRLMAMRLLNFELGEVEIVACETIEEVRWRACEANLRHGQRLKAKHLRPAFRALINAGGHQVGDRFKSYREIAPMLPGVSPATVWRWMLADFPEIAAAMGRDVGKAKGGLPDGPSTDALLLETALDLVAEVEALSPGIRRASRKRRLAGKLREVAALIDPEGIILGGGFDLSSYA